MSRVIRWLVWVVGRWTEITRSPWNVAYGTERAPFQVRSISDSGNPEQADERGNKV
jgi:hypothetical protein